MSILPSQSSSTPFLQIVQFELPSRRDVQKCVVTKETVEKGIQPTLVTAAAEPEDEGDGEQAAESA